MAQVIREYDSGGTSAVLAVLLVALVLLLGFLLFRSARDGSFDLAPSSAGNDINIELPNAQAPNTDVGPAPSGPGNTGSGSGTNPDPGSLNGTY